MKLNSGKVNSRGNNTEAAFTLIEMIGVLAVIAILAALLIPKVFNAINSARINNTAVSVDTIKTAVTDHYGKYGSFDHQSGTGASIAPTNHYDLVLMSEGLLDQPFAVKIGSGAFVNLLSGASCNANQGYKLDGVTNLTTTMALVSEVVITNVLAQDAVDLNTLIDGTNAIMSSGSPTDLTDADTGGRVEYAAPVQGQTTVYIFLTGR